MAVSVHMRKKTLSSVGNSRGAWMDDRQTPADRISNNFDFMDTLCYIKRAGIGCLLPLVFAHNIIIITVDDTAGFIGFGYRTMRMAYLSYFIQNDA